MMKLLGAALVMTGCGGVGFSLGASHRRTAQTMEQLAAAMDHMVWQLNWRMPPLEELCRGAAEAVGGRVGRVLGRLGEELRAQLLPDVASCMQAALAAEPKLPTLTRTYLENLGSCLGKFDLQGQVAALEAAGAQCRREAEKLRQDQAQRLRNYRTFGLCAGAAVVILLL